MNCELHFYNKNLNLGYRIQIQQVQWRRLTIIKQAHLIRLRLQSTTWLFNIY